MLNKQTKESEMSDCMDDRTNGCGTPSSRAVELFDAFLKRFHYTAMGLVMVGVSAMVWATQFMTQPVPWFMVFIGASAVSAFCVMLTMLLVKVRRMGPPWGVTAGTLFASFAWFFSMGMWLGFRGYPIVSTASLIIGIGFPFLGGVIGVMLQVEKRSSA